jgi:hypothetical protein
MLQNPLPTVGMACSCITKGLIDAARAKNACPANKTRIGRTMRIFLKQMPLVGDGTVSEKPSRRFIRR